MKKALAGAISVSMFIIVVFSAGFAGIHNFFLKNEFQPDSSAYDYEQAYMEGDININILARYVELPMAAVERNISVAKTYATKTIHYYRDMGKSKPVYTIHKGERVMHGGSTDGHRDKFPIVDTGRYVYSLPTDVAGWRLVYPMDTEDQEAPTELLYVRLSDLETITQHWVSTIEPETYWDFYGPFTSGLARMIALEADRRLYEEGVYLSPDLCQPVMPVYSQIMLFVGILSLAYRYRLKKREQAEEIEGEPVLCFPSRIQRLFGKNQYFFLVLSVLLLMIVGLQAWSADVQNQALEDEFRRMSDDSFPEDYVTALKNGTISRNLVQNFGPQNTYYYRGKVKTTYAPTDIRYYKEIGDAEPVYVIEQGMRIAHNGRTSGETENIPWRMAACDVMSLPTDIAGWRLVYPMDTPDGLAPDEMLYVRLEDLQAVVEMWAEENTEVLSGLRSGFGILTKEAWVANLLFAVDQGLYTNGVYLSPEFYRPLFPESSVMLLIIAFCSAIIWAVRRFRQCVNAGR